MISVAWNWAAGVHEILGAFDRVPQERDRAAAALSLRAEGIWDPGPWIVAEGQTTTIDIAELRRTQATDARGNTIPLTVSTGPVHWSILGGQDYRGIVGRVEQVDVQHNVSSTYACPMPTADNFHAAWIEPDDYEAQVSEWVKFTAMEQDEDAYMQSVGWPYDISDILYWVSYSPSVASSGGNGWFLAQSGGYATIQASGESNGWEDYQGEGDPGNHGWIEEYATLQVVQSVQISGSSTVWWFGGHQPSGYQTAVTLTSSGGSSTQWSITAGADKVQLSTTSGSQTVVTSTGNAFSAAAGDILITATAGGGLRRPTSR